MDPIGLTAVFTFKAGNAVNEMQRTQRGVTSLEKSLYKLRSGLNDIRYGFDYVRNGFRPFAFAGAAAIGLMAKKAIEFDDSITKVGSVLGASKFKQSRKNLEDMARTISLMPSIKKGPAEVADAMAVLAKAGITSTKAIEGSVVPGLQLAATESLKAEKGINILLTTMRSFDMDVGNAAEARRTADILSRASDSSRISVEELEVAMRFGATEAKNMGQSLHETVGYLALFRDQGAQASSAGTELANFFAAFGDEKKVRRLEALIGSVRNASGELIEVHEIIRRLERVLSKSEVANIERAQRLSKIWTVRGRRAAGRFMTAGANNILRYTREAGFGEGTVAEKADIRASSVKMSMKAIGVAFENIAISLNSEAGLLGGFRAVEKSVTGIATQMVMIDKLGVGGARAEAKEKGQIRAFNAAESLRGVASEVGFALEELAASTITFIQSMFSLDSELTRSLIKFTALSPAIALFGVALSSVFNVIKGSGQIALGVYTLFTAANEKLTRTFGPVASVWIPMVSDGFERLGERIKAVPEAIKKSRIAAAVSRELGTTASLFWKTFETLAAVPAILSGKMKFVGVTDELKNMMKPGFWGNAWESVKAVPGILKGESTFTGLSPEGLSLRKSLQGTADKLTSTMEKVNWGIVKGFNWVKDTPKRLKAGWVALETKGAKLDGVLGKLLKGFAGLVGPIGVAIAAFSALEWIRDTAQERVDRMYFKHLLPHALAGGKNRNKILLTPEEKKRHLDRLEQERVQIRKNTRAYKMFNATLHDMDQIYRSIEERAGLEDRSITGISDLVKKAGATPQEALRLLMNPNAKAWIQKPDGSWGPAENLLEREKLAERAAVMEEIRRTKAQMELDETLGLDPLLKSLNEQLKNLQTKVDVNVDGKKIASAVANHNLGIAERTGARTSPWQRKAIFDHGYTA